MTQHQLLTSTALSRGATAEAKIAADKAAAVVAAAVARRPVGKPRKTSPVRRASRRVPDSSDGGDGGDDDGEPPKPPKSTADLAAFSIPEFCRRHMISRSTYYNLKRHGQGPRETRVGLGERKRVIITKASAEAWLKKQERQSA
jgi:predicted DNA-binding transcriptional regulator AlpA